jgi:FAD/FMN-containing dehydrogenase
MTSHLGTAPTTLDALAAALDRPLHRPGSPRYDALALPWNVAVTHRPIAVVEAATARDVASAVRFASRAGVQISVQATGHHGAVAVQASSGPLRSDACSTFAPLPSVKEFMS